MLSPDIFPDTLPASDVGKREQVETLFQAWVDAVGRRDSRRIAQLHVPGGVLQLPLSAGARGRDEIRRRCDQWLHRESCETRFLLGETRLYEAAHVATCNGRFALRWPSGSNGEEDRGRLLLVAEKEDGRWGLRFSGLFSDAFLSRLATLTR